MRGCGGEAGCRSISITIDNQYLVDDLRNKLNPDEFSSSSEDSGMRVFNSLTSDELKITISILATGYLSNTA
jgi:hypothetical protein